jgi:hypothetical protein
MRQTPVRRDWQTTTCHLLHMIHELRMAFAFLMIEKTFKVIFPDMKK